MGNHLVKCKEFGARDTQDPAHVGHCCKHRLLVDVYVFVIRSKDDCRGFLSNSHTSNIVDWTVTNNPNGLSCAPTVKDPSLARPDERIKDINKPRFPAVAYPARADSVGGTFALEQGA